MGLLSSFEAIAMMIAALYEHDISNQQDMHLFLQRVQVAAGSGNRLG